MRKKGRVVKAVYSSFKNVRFVSLHKTIHVSALGFYWLQQCRQGARPQDRNYNSGLIALTK